MLGKPFIKGKFVVNTTFMGAPSLDNEFIRKDGGADSDTMQKRIIEEERAKYFKGEGRSFSWEEVKQMALNKKQRNELKY